MKIAGMMRVKNEARWIDEAVRSLAPVCDAGVFIFDDHSTDDTRRIARKAASNVVVVASPFDNLDEARDKDMLLQLVWNCEEPDWVVCIDGDEVLTEESQDGIRVAARAGCAYAFAFRVVYLWDRPDQIRTDGIYGNFWRPSMFNAKHSTREFKKSGRGGNFHCSNVPADLMNQAQRAGVRLKHYGYIDRVQRLAKFDWYNSIDPGNRNEDCYRHMVQGDTAEVPADAVLKWAGPLQLLPWA